MFSKAGTQQCNKWKVQETLQEDAGKIQLIHLIRVNNKREKKNNQKQNAKKQFGGVFGLLVFFQVFFSQCLILYTQAPLSATYYMKPIQNPTVISKSHLTSLYPSTEGISLRGRWIPGQHPEKLPVLVKKLSKHKVQCRISNEIWIGSF